MRSPLIASGSRGGQGTLGDVFPAGCADHRPDTASRQRGIGISTLRVRQAEHIQRGGQEIVPLHKAINLLSPSSSAGV
ncbi:MAG: hypothetical protein QF681_00505, partial [Vicinamibacterales bacterium]|nr:hypothetical protein [Vicinamibacterales bacterium]